MKKQIILLVLILLPLAASADESGKCGDNVTYYFDESESTLTISGLGEMHSFKYANYPSPWKDYRNKIKNVIIENGVTTIGKSAFINCSTVNTVTIPESIITIDETAFAGCTDLTNLNIPESVTTIGESAFRGCSGLTSINIPQKITNIAKGTFNGCSGLTSLNLPNNLTIISESAFNNCSNLTSIIIPDNVTDIGKFAFNACSKLASVYFPEKLASIGESAFSDCNQLMRIVSAIKIIFNISQTVFSEVTYLNAKLYMPESKLQSYEVANGWKEFVYKEECKIIDINTGNKYSLTYVIDGEKYISYEVEYGKSIIPEANPSKEGYTFSGWSEIPETMPAKDVIVTGTFTVNKYKLTYMVDGKEYKTSFEVEYGSAIIPEDEPTKEGYTFSGWSEIPTTMPAKDVTINGTFTINKYKLTYQVDGEEYKTLEVEYNALIIPEAEPTKEGYTFSGWSEIPHTMPAKDVTVTGTFTINKYKLTYNVDGEEYKTFELEYGATITAIAEPAKEGYTFSGWSEIPETMPAKDVVITGTFTKGTYKLTYQVDGKTYKTISYDYGASVTPEAEPTKEGYTFSGWSDIPSTMPAEDVTVTGTFTINKYKLTYKVDGEEYETFEIEYGSTITAIAEPTKEGYTFSGWSYIPSKMPAEDVTITGTFTANKYKLTYMVDGKEYKTKEVAVDAAITPEAEPTKEGYTFSGWSWIPSKMPAEDVTITGTFTINKYTITYMVDGVLYTTEEVEYSSKIVPPTVPQKEGYEFAWGEYPETMPAKNITISGTYTTTGIGTITLDEGEKKYYTLDGHRIETLRKGVNIVRTSDGKTKKIVMK